MNIKNAITTFNFVAVILVIVYLTVNPIGSTKSIATQVSESTDEERIKKYLLDNNEIVVEALTRYQEKKACQDIEKQKELVRSSADALEKDESDPFIGNKNGTKIVVEFFDYNCGHCKTMLPIKKKLVEENADTKFIFKELPIFGDHSSILSRAALAVQRMDATKYFTIHSEFLLNSAKYKDLNSITEYVGTLGLDKAKFVEVFNDKTIEDKLRANFELAQKIGLHGTPAYIINNEVIPGAVSYEMLTSKFK